MELSPVAEDYLKSIYQLETADGRPVRTVDLSEEVGVTSPTVSSMIDTLDERGLVDYTPYKGVRLTERGETVVLRLVRNHRLLETFLMESLEYSWSEVHDEADRLEHHVSETFVSRLETFLGEPRVDPHGDPIPDVELRMPEEDLFTPLTEFEIGSVVTVEQVPHRDPDVREFLSSRDIGPGTRLTVDAVSSVGLITVEPSLGDDSIALPTHVARRIGARLTDPPQD
ncbi:metal-dependent transcriptional regulator [Natrarchaeobaculum sulfurireducens]|uniref:Mn-dependent transcriptional regulator (DtxR family) n=1 Tax=Natrarchaeobaculum sulfurireducens TaxID=2044521 RepID=A0A346PMS1_9EURY|nr:metal-dependent transcriptional regulator [Natrarchaeobaculum sulfurireducens]AXR79020.1 Mn-dependent transcriptional regulator (DtxR family) [Natrarchaeobaculum sulfurireducens]AXR80816.1 Mn-dependent transcriptional regulator MntR [Natrarchaeobaculum sulfurireducens]